MCGETGTRTGTGTGTGTDRLEYVAGRRPDTRVVDVVLLDVGYGGGRSRRPKACRSVEQSASWSNQGRFALRKLRRCQKPDIQASVLQNFEQDKDEKKRKEKIVN